MELRWQLYGCIRGTTHPIYVAPPGALMRVEIGSGRMWAPSTPTLLIEEGYMTNPGAFFGRTYDIDSDGQRFLMIKEGASDAKPTAAAASIIVVLNWVEELKRLIPLK